MKKSVRSLFVLALTLFFSFSLAQKAEATPAIIFLQGPGGANSGINVNAGPTYSSLFTTGVDFQSALQGFADLAGARFSVTGIDAQYNPLTTGNVNHYTQGGTFTLLNATQQVLLSGILGLGQLTSNTTGTSLFTNQLFVTGGMFANYFPYVAVTGTHGSLQLDFNGLPTPHYSGNTLTGYDWNTEFVRGLITSGAESCGCHPVPEPATLALLGLGAVPYLRRRRLASQVA